MRIFASLTNRIFFGSALLAVLPIAAAIYNVNGAVSRQAEQELLRGLEEAGTLIEENRRVQVDGFAREARLIADLPRFKSAIYERDAPTALGVAREYQQQLAADLFLVTDRQGRELARVIKPAARAASYDRLPGVRAAQAGREASWFWPYPGGVLQVVTVPVWINPDKPEILGSLSVGFSLDDAVAARFRTLTNSDIAFGVGGTIQASTLPPAAWPRLVPLLASGGASATVTLDDGEYVAMTRALSRPRDGEAPPAGAMADAPAAVAIVLRSRTERLRFLTALHTRLLATAGVAVLAATLLSYAIARTVTRPLGAITATMREMSATGDLTRRLPARAGGRWDDEDARLLASTFNTMTESIGRFQHDAAQRERLSSLGRLSTVVAHEIRNPLMIIRAALRTLRRRVGSAPDLCGPIADIDEETARLNRIVSEVLDFAKPIRFDMAPVEVNRVCEEAAKAVREGSPGPPITLRLDPGVPRTILDGERLRLTLVNVLSNASAAVAERQDGAPAPDPIVLTTTHGSGRIRVDVRDRGAGIAPENLPRVFDPFFTTRRTGTGLGLAISRNIIEGMGGTIAIESSPGEGTLVRLDLPVRS